MTFFISRQLFQKFTPFIQNLLPFLCISLSLSLFLLSFMFFYKKNTKKIKNSRLIIGGEKRGFAPILIIGGACPGCPPRVYAYARRLMHVYTQTGTGTYKHIGGHTDRQAHKYTHIYKHPYRHTLHTHFKTFVYKQRFYYLFRLHL